MLRQSLKILLKFCATNAVSLGARVQHSVQPRALVELSRIFLKVKLIFNFFKKNI